MTDSPRLREGEIFLEPPELEGHLGLALKVDKVLHQTQTRFQHLAVVEAGPLGRVLLLDGAIQITTADEAAYHEMLAHVPLLTHPDPRRVLIIGGGDGGTLREVLRHRGVERCELCEIDGEVIEASRRFLPRVACALDDPRARVRVEDGVAFLRGREAAYDVILVDSSDPEGPARGLFGREFYAEVRRALRPGGLAAGQAESFAFYGPLVAEMMGFLAEMFPLAMYYQAQVPSYLGGAIGFALSSLGPDPLEGPDLRRLAGLGPLAHYTASLHQAAFALPAGHLARLPRGCLRRQG
jgi:spermidine synthase